MKNSNSPIQSPPTASFKLVEKAGGSQVEIKQVQTFLFQRILPLTIGLIIILLMGFTLLGGRGEGTGLLVDIMNQARDHPVWSKVARGIVIAVIVYLSFRIAKIGLGTLVMRVDQHSFEIKRGILGIGFSRSVSRSEITGLKQTTWTEKQKNESMDTLQTVDYWKLELMGDKSITLLTDETNPEDSDWLGHYLSNWFEVPFVKEER